MARGHAVLAAGLTLLAVTVSQAGGHADDDPADNMQKNFGMFMEQYLPPGDDKFTEKFTGGNSSWRDYMSKYGGGSSGYDHYIHQFGGSQADYGQYVSLYSSMAGTGVTSGGDYNSKGKSQLAAWNKTMAKTYDKYIPGSYEHFAAQATEERAAGKVPTEGGGGAQQNAGGAGQGGGGGSGGPSETGSSGSGGGGGESGEGSSQQQHENGGGEQHEVGYKRFAEPYVSEYAAGEEHNAYDYEGIEFASAGMDMGSVGDFSNYVENYAGNWVPEGSASAAKPSKPAGMEATSRPASTPADEEFHAAAHPNLEAAQKAAMGAEASVTQLHRASLDKAYATWSVAKHLPQQGLSKLSDAEAHQALQKAMARLKGLSKDSGVQELEEASQAASSAISRLGKAETEALKRRAEAAHKASVRSARQWQDAITASAQSAQTTAELQAKAFPDDLELQKLVLRCKVLTEQARTDGQELERSLEEALGKSVQSAQLALLQRAKKRENSLHAVLMEVADLTVKDTKSQQALPSQKAPSATDRTVDSSSTLLVAFSQNFKAVPASYLLIAISVAGTVCAFAGVSSRLQGRSRHVQSSQSLSEVPLLSLA